MVLRFCCDHSLPLTGQQELNVYSEHHHTDNSKNKYIFRAHPSYRDDSGQVGNVWYDWANFDVDDQSIPCQIMCFVNITSIIDNPLPVNGYPIQETGNYAVVRRFVSQPKKHPRSSLVLTGKLWMDCFYFTVTVSYRLLLLCKIISPHHPSVINFLLFAIVMLG